MKLNYKASNIARAESETGKKFFETFTNLGKGVPGINDLLFLFNAGGGSDEEFDKLFAKGIDTVLMAIMEGISDAGFLGQKIDLSAVKKSMEEAKNAAIASQSSGETAKA